MDEDRVEYPEDRYLPDDGQIQWLLRALREDRQYVDGNDLEHAGLGAANSSGWSRLLGESCVVGWSKLKEHDMRTIFEVDYDKLMARLCELHGEERILRLMLELET